MLHKSFYCFLKITAFAFAVISNALLVFYAHATDHTSQAIGAAPIEVTVRVQKIRSTKGKVIVAAHESSSTFPSDWARATTTASLPALSMQTDVKLRLPKAGRYAIIVIHDEDGNGKMSKNFIGLPREGYTIGTNPSELEFPIFSRATVILHDQVQLELGLIYP